MHKNNLEIGRELDIFSIDERSGSGLPLFHPNGARLRDTIVGFLREVNDQLGFQEVWTPHLFNVDLWKASGHYSAYKSRMFLLKIGDHEYGLKPMNCPAHALIFSSKPRSYRDLPVMYSEFATVYRNEQEGELTGLLRVRSITQDDGHVFCSEDQVEGVLRRLVEAAVNVLKTFGLGRVSIAISTKPPDAIGSPEVWDRATNTLVNVTKASGLEYKIAEGEGAFYGPKIDIFAYDNLDREWQLSTIQLDFYLGERLGAKYTGADGSFRHPVIIHRALVGSLERFIGILLENYQGKLPTWLSPEQARIMPVSEKQAEYAAKIYDEFARNGIRCSLDTDAQTLQKRIKKATLDAVPYLVIVGEKEASGERLSIRLRTGEQINQIAPQMAVQAIKQEILTRGAYSSGVKDLSDKQ